MNLPRSGEYNAEDVGEEIKERSSGSIDGYSDEVSELIHVSCSRFGSLLGNFPILIRPCMRSHSHSCSI